uniref:formin-2-like n=1 Tax=Ictidomys tridecemlineatus TaxID=43179 RepID=UPI001A9F5228|nr:formin-2-like [Ictidomys tridecemlineatus]XP_040132882.1 formin-2-like [Ictidomys tridecemlineatus]XP_040132889.1 formin-2-like [Ictidomys tridecemlineatus]XP_040132892.1 formin-2-like [Ictidomys tridecemlineatus]XP_040132895.1 formin-2-like [Ictidomys tridecemlineatus]XP_040132900.1 formin-2-like [Ictidomys tridecemlineatus]XP_040132905.1 formin-2-like [Ictidomys tridecemlineatus]XP_040132911.1 formin-2-like [Ictidomys tridecemlineatus]XP_040132919.1 formin-2-like [Ictidomys tridecemlin
MPRVGQAPPAAGGGVCAPPRRPQVGQRPAPPGGAGMGVQSLPWPVPSPSLTQAPLPKAQSSLASRLQARGAPRPSVPLLPTLGLSEWPGCPLRSPPWGYLQLPPLGAVSVGCPVPAHPPLALAREWKFCWQLVPRAQHSLGRSWTVSDSFSLLILFIPWSLLPRPHLPPPHAQGELRTPSSPWPGEGGSAGAGSAGTPRRARAPEAQPVCPQRTGRMEACSACQEPSQGVGCGVAGPRGPAEALQLGSPRLGPRSRLHLPWGPPRAGPRARREGGSLGEAGPWVPHTRTAPRQLGSEKGRQDVKGAPRFHCAP